jgi:hypothetical protein
MRLVTAGLLGLLIGTVQLAGGAQSTGSGPVIARLTGTWKEDVSKRKVGGAIVDLRFQRDTKGGLQELRGPDVLPDVQSIVFDGMPHKLAKGNNSIAWKQLTPSTFERVISEGTQTLGIRRIRISTDGKTLTEATEVQRATGPATVNTIVYQRASGDQQGLVGRWKAQSFTTNTPGVVTYAPAGTGGLTFADANNC